jgi:uncharacterized protein (DUF1684 family)
MSELDEFRARKDEYMRSDRHSPLTRQQREAFQGLRYFPEAPALRLEVAVERFDDDQEVQIQTSTGETVAYRRYGRFRFEVEGREAQLTIFADEQGYFLPFVDSLAGSETYPAGRYVEPEPLPGGKFLVDFNYAYNPYCAYNEMWSCPLTPFENRLKVAIRAGEKIFEGRNH